MVLLGQEWLILAMYTGTKKNCRFGRIALFGGSDRVPLDCRWVGFPLLGPAKVGWDRNRVVGGDTWPRVLHTSHVFGNKEKLMIWMYCWLFWGSDGVPLGSRWVGFPPRSS